MIAVCFSFLKCNSLISLNFNQSSIEESQIKSSISIVDKANNQESNSDTNNELCAPLPTPGYFKNVSDRVLKAKVKLGESPYDLDAWNILIKDAQVWHDNCCKQSFLSNIILGQKY